MARYCPECGKQTLTLDSSGYECSDCSASGNLDDVVRLASKFDFKTGKRSQGGPSGISRSGQSDAPDQSKHAPQGLADLIDMQAILRGEKIEPNCKHCGTTLMMRLNEVYAKEGGPMFRVLCLKCKKVPCATMGCPERAVDIVPGFLTPPTGGPSGIDGKYPDALPVCRECKEGWLIYKKRSKVPKVLLSIVPLPLAYAFFEFRFPLAANGGILQGLLITLAILLAITLFIYGRYQLNLAANDVPVLRKQEYIVPASWTGSAAVTLFPDVYKRLKRISRRHRGW